MPTTTATNDMKDRAAEVLQAMGLLIDREDLPIWGAKAIGRAIGRSAPTVYNMILCDLLPVTKVGGSYVTTLRRLRTEFLEAGQSMDSRLRKRLAGLTVAELQAFQDLLRTSLCERVETDAPLIEAAA
jgi:hypothetical protein